ncbi:hypothetical protein ACXR0O_05995 [Verrucomicrobiota bacterium sgz303538]
MKASSSDERTVLRNLKAPIARNNRETLYQAIGMKTEPDFGREEIESHFSNMPQRYWLQVNEATCRWHLATVHSFFEHVAQAHTITTSPVVQWRMLPERDVIEVAVCSWDRPALLMNIAGALSRAGFDILRADVHTRADHIALDIFQVREADGRLGLHEMRLKYASRLLAAAMAAPQAFTLPIAVTRDEGTELASESEAEVIIDNETSSEYTVLRVDASDHVGLLFRLLEALVACNVSVEQATIVTMECRAKDVFLVTDSEGQKIDDAERMSVLRERIRRAINASYSFVPSVWGADPLQLIDRTDEVEL